MIVIFNHLHFKAFTCARLRASHHSSIVDQDVNLRSKQRRKNWFRTIIRFYDDSLIQSWVEILTIIFLCRIGSIKLMKVKVVGYSCLLLLVSYSCCCYHQIVKNYLEFVSQHLRKAPWNLFTAILYTLQTAQIQPTQAKFHHRPKASRTSEVPLRGVTNLLNEATKT